MEGFVQTGESKAGYLKPSMEIVEIAPNIVVLTSCTEYSCRAVSVCDSYNGCDHDVNCEAECFGYTGSGCPGVFFGCGSYTGAGCYPSDSGCGKDGDCLVDTASG